jgi:hypothetical protein
MAPSLQTRLVERQAFVGSESQPAASEHFQVESVYATP